MQECLLILKKKPWYLDSGCSRHMTGDRESFVSFKNKEGGTVTFGNNDKAKIKGIGSIGKKGTIFINNVQYVEGLKHNLLSISQLCDDGYEVSFNQNSCIVKIPSSDKILFLGKRHKNLYIFYLDDLSSESCLLSKEKDKWLWHRRCGHTSMKNISILSKLDLVRGLPKLNFEKDSICEACIKGKQVKSSFHSKNIVSTHKPLELLHIDLFGPVKTSSLSGKKYGFVIVDDFSRYTWVLFLKNKDDSFEAFKIFCKKVQNERNSNIVAVRSDHGGEFENISFKTFFDENGISHNFSCPRTPQQNGVVERKNRTLQEMARTMINESNVEKYFWAEAINTSCYVLNRVTIRKILKKTPYELWKNRTPNISYFHIFGCYCYILNNKDSLGKFDSKSDKGIFLGYSSISKGYRIYNLRNQCVEDTMHVMFDELNIAALENSHEDEVTDLEAIPNTQSSDASNTMNIIQEAKNNSEQPTTNPPKGWKSVTDHPHEQIIGDTSDQVRTRNFFKNNSNNMAMISQVEPKNINDALKDESWMEAMTEEL